MKANLRLLAILRRSIVILLVLSIYSCTFAYQASAAAPGDISSPFDIGTSWNICQGYDNINGSHTNSSRLSLDFTSSGCDSAASGRNIHSPYQGVVSWYAPASGSLCLTANSGISLMFTHIDSSLTTGTAVVSGQIVGTVAAPGQRQNNNVAHLHAQAWSTPMCINASDQVPFSFLNNTRICGLPDMPISGPNSLNTGTWGGLPFTAQSCNGNIPTDSSGVYRFYSTSIKRHVYTSDINELITLRNRYQGLWNYEGISYHVPKINSCNSSSSVYRFYSASLKTHLYTMDENEKAYLMANFPPTIWSYEGVSFCADMNQANPTEKPVYRFYSPAIKTHLYTIDENEKDSIIRNFSSDIWSYEGISYYAYPVQ